MDRLELLAQRNAAKEINGVKIFTVDTFDFDTLKTVKLCKRPKHAHAGKYKRKVLDVYMSFDIETSRLPNREHSIIYVWQLGIENHTVILGRTWQEFKRCMIALTKYIPEKAILKIAVHNLAYEFSFLKGIYRFNPDDVFILDGRRVAKCRMMDCIEFYCSYIQSNMSLRLLTDSYEVEHRKLSGDDYDYTITRYPWSELHEEELPYIIHDVIGLNEAMKKRNIAFGDNLYTMPLTSTGYVRREVKRAMNDFPHEKLMTMIPDFETYELLEEAFRGGNTHANRYYVGKILS